MLCKSTSDARPMSINTAHQVQTDQCSSKIVVYLIQNILTSTKNASLIIPDFSAMLYKNEQPRTASLCRGWLMLENDFNLICR